MFLDKYEIPMYVEYLAVIVFGILLGALFAAFI